MLKSVVLLSFLSMAVTGCLANDAQRTLIGAGVGAAAADVTGNNMATGAVIGAGVGLLAK